MKRSQSASDLQKMEPLPFEIIRANLEKGEFDLEVPERKKQFYEELGNAINRNLRYCGKNEIPLTAAEVVVEQMEKGQRLPEEDKKKLTHEIANIYDTSSFKNAVWYYANQGAKAAAVLGLVAGVIAVGGLGFTGAAAALEGGAIGTGLSSAYAAIQAAGGIQTAAGIKASADAVIAGACGVPAIVTGALAQASGAITSASIPNSLASAAALSDKVGSVLGVTVLAGFCAKMGYKVYAKTLDTVMGHSYAKKATEIERVVRKAIEKERGPVAALGR